MKEFFNFLLERFGIGNLPSEHVLIDRGDIWISSKQALKIRENIKFNRVGIRLIRVFKNGYKLTTAGAQIIGHLAKKNVVNLKDENLAMQFISGSDINYMDENLEKGQVIVKCNKDILGVAIYDGEKLKNQIPRSKRIVK
ncbi:MAG: hypothetical protein N2504_03750 [candidate division WOR-3 bacterium]|nr:hypothetical protein [candidate division WOR-3 bacterium]MCX7947682.1 hypothetical protein [candidate division WOR-3 bacterium]MDW8150559.1 hypothetical protein [candidate division WOR-3 bacterium]